MPFENTLYTRYYIPQFERENPGIRVRFHHYDSYSSRILMLRAGGIAPDVMRQNIEFGAQYLRRGFNLPLDRYIDGPDGVDRRDFIPVTWEPLRYRERTYGIPQDINIRALYYNRDLFEAAGIPPPTTNWTWADLKRAGEQLSDPARNGGHPDVAGLVTGFRATDWLPFYYQAGGQVWNADKSRPQLDTPEAVEALTFFKTVAGSSSISQASSERGGLGPSTFFQNGRAAMLIDGSWRSPQLKKSAPDLRFGVAPLPRGKQAMSVSTSCFWSVSAQTRHPDEAWKLVKFLSDKEQLIRYWQYLWVAPPARWSALRSPEFQQVTGAGADNPGLSGAAEFQEKCAWIPYTLEHGQTTTEFIGPFTRQLYDKLSFAVEDVVLQGGEPQAALKKAQREMLDQIREVEKTFVQ
ncbi:MAG: extracellular solute-binding protein family 1 [Armatimonadetes bacterium]|nr:extracellular solute-binding protein family 1 [Armatimonadota bacterium]